jgi:Protein of unknown function (DUF3313)
MTSKTQTLLVLFVAAALLTGCGSTPPPRTGFLGDYNQLEKITDSKLRYISPDLAAYNKFMVDPVQIRMDSKVDLDQAQLSEVAQYFRMKFVEVLKDSGYQVVDTVDGKTARVRIAITEISKATWWLNVAPTSKVTGAGVGGAAMEGEVIDAVSGIQLAAVVKSGKGNQFEVDTFSELDDVKDVIDTWAKEASERFEELRSNN